MLENCDWGSNKIPADLELAWDLLLQRVVHKSMGPVEINPRVQKKPVDIITGPLDAIFNSCGSLERSQLTGSWKMLPRFSRRVRRKTLVIAGLSASSQCLVTL